MLSVGIGGFIGTCLRYGANKFIKLPAFPMSTLVVNVVAGFLLGMIIGYERHTSPLNNTTRLFLTTGILGGLSTFSAFSLETVDLFEKNKYMMGTANVVVNVLFSILGVVVGMYIMKLTIAKG